MLATVLTATSVPLAAQEHAFPAPARGDQADAVLERMTPEEKVILVHAIMPLPLGPNPPAILARAIPSVAYVPASPPVEVAGPA